MSTVVSNTTIEPPPTCHLDERLDDVAPWAQLDLRQLDLHSSALASLDWCRPTPASVDDGFDEVAYLEGYGSENVLQALALTSKANGPVVFEGSRATLAHHYLGEAVAISGSQTASLGDVEVQLLYIPTGTILALDSRHRDGGGRIDSLTLSPAGTEAWRQEMDRRSCFLWPLVDATATSGKSSRFVLALDPLGQRPIGELVDAHDAANFRIGNRSKSYVATGVHFSISDVMRPEC